jgi:hypothetical protein
MQDRTRDNTMEVLDRTRRLIMIGADIGFDGLHEPDRLGRPKLSAVNGRDGVVKAGMDSMGASIRTAVVAIAHV